MFFLFYLIIYSCEGRCLRSFHATEEAGRDSLCPSLGYTSAEVDVSTGPPIFSYYVWIKGNERKEKSRMVVTFDFFFKYFFF